MTIYLSYEMVLLCFGLLANHHPVFLIELKKNSISIVTRQAESTKSRISYSIWILRNTRAGHQTPKSAFTFYSARAQVTLPPSARDVAVLSLFIVGQTAYLATEPILNPLLFTIYLTYLHIELILKHIETPFGTLSHHEFQ